MASLFDPSLTRPLAEDRLFLQQTAVPIVTLAAAYPEDVKRAHGMSNQNITRDIVFSRAHYSMAVAIAQQAWGGTVDPKKAWVVDPTNYVTKRDWLSISATERIGKTIARHSLLKQVKNSIDKFGRRKLPILESVSNPLLYLTQELRKPILSLHIGAGNLLIEQGRTVLQVVTDPHVRSEYLVYADNSRLSWAVFDEATKIELLEKAAMADKEVDPNRVVVTGPPIDPRVVATATKKHPWRSGSLHVCLTTGGLGTNKEEMLAICRHIFPKMHRKNLTVNLLVYCGTHQDIFQAVLKLAKEHHLTAEPLVDKNAQLRVIYHPQIVDANELLIKHAFNWADGFITKPSGDMAYDAVAAGCFLLTLEEWGEWEHNIRQRFEHHGIARKAQVDHIVEQLEVLTSAHGKAQSWVESAQQHALALPPIFRQGAANILQAYRQLVKDEKFTRSESAAGKSDSAE